MIHITATPAWRAAHPGASIGLLEISGVDNTLPNPQLNQRKHEVEARLRLEYAGYTRPDFVALPVMDTYTKYYKRFDKTYHVLLQVESIALKGKSLPEVSPLVDANFAAEVDTFVLAAGHDADRWPPTGAAMALIVGMVEKKQILEESAIRKALADLEQAKHHHFFGR